MMHPNVDVLKQFQYPSHAVFCTPVMNLWAHSEVINVFTKCPTPNQNDIKLLYTKVLTWVEMDGAVEDTIHDFPMYLKP